MAELKLELKLRSLPVSGTKTDLIERLKPFQDPPSTVSPPATVPMEISTTTPAFVLPAQQGAAESMSSTPPVSPAPTEPFTLQQDVGMCDAPAEAQLEGCGPSPLPPCPVPEEKDRRLHEKERQIEELMRKLEQEQRLVEELKMQLEVEKRGQSVSSSDPPPAPPSLPSHVPPVLNSNPVKVEGPLQANCSPPTLPGSLLGPPAAVVKLEDVTCSSGQTLQSNTQLFTQIRPQPPPAGATSPQLLTQSKLQSRPAVPGLQQFFISHPGGVSQVLGQPQTLVTTSGQTGAQILLPTTIQLPSTTVGLQVRANPRPVCLQA